MSFWSRLVNVARGERVIHDIDAELESHIDEAIRHGRDPVEARRALGSVLRHREESRDVRLVAWLDSLRADVIVAWRQLKKKKVASASAVCSLALAVGACVSAFRLVDALLLRPLPVAAPEQLYVAGRQGIGPDDMPRVVDGWAYPSFQRMRDAVADRAALIAVSNTQSTDLTYGSDQEIEKASVQYVSGAMFDLFGLRPFLGRLLTERDDLEPGAHPLAVLAHDYWVRRFGGDPRVIGRSFHLGLDVFEVVGIAPEGFTGIEPGTMTSIFVPTMMHPFVTRSDATWHRIIARVKPGVPLESVRQTLHAASRAFEEERAKGFPPISRARLDSFLNQTVVLEPAATGVSSLQRSYRPALWALAVLVTLVLLLACANVANLMTVQAAARAREMALRISIGAGRWRLVQLVLVESAMLGLFATTLGGVFAWWAAPFVVGRINPADNPAQLDLAADWRVLAFAAALALVVTLLLGVAPALRASAIAPVHALKGGEDPRARRRLLHALIAAQVAFCVLVLFISGLFVTTFDRLANQSPGFSNERLVTLDTVAQRGQSPVLWNQVAEHLRGVAGIEAVALAGWPLLRGTANNNLISINGAPASEVLAFFLNVSPEWRSVMKVPLIAGRDFRANDVAPGVAIVTESFAKQYFNGENPVGHSFQRRPGEPLYQVVGLVGDVRYKNVREPILPIAFVPFQSVDAKGASRPITDATFIVRTASTNPLALVSILRAEVSRARPELRVSNIRTQALIQEAQTVRERLLAMLALFFAAVALALAGIGLYGVLDYSVLQRRREIGIRVALGARVGDIARRVTVEVFSMVLAGAAAGVGLGLASVRYLETLFYEVKATDPSMIAFPLALMFALAVLAALPPVIHASRIDPVRVLGPD